MMLRSWCPGHSRLRYLTRPISSERFRSSIRLRTSAHNSFSSAVDISDDSWNDQTRQFLRVSSSSPTTPSEVVIQAQALMDQLMINPAAYTFDDNDKNDELAIKQRQEQDTNIDELLDAKLAFEFLDRLFELERTTTTYNNEWTTNCLNAVMMLWKESCLHHHKRNNNSIIPPSDVLVKLDEYRAHSNFLVPDVQTYNILMDGAALTAKNDAIDLCLQIWNWMWEESRTDSLIKPDVVTLRTLMKAWVMSDHPEGPENCEKLAEEWIKRTGKSKGIRKSLIHVWALANPTQAEAYLKDLALRHFQNPDLEEAPDTIAWNRVISAYAIRHNQPRKAADLLEEFWDFSTKLRETNADETTIIPDLFSYNSVLEGWARQENATEANKTFLRLQTAASTSPNIISYTSAIKANSQDFAEVEKLAEECLQTYDEQEADSVSLHLELDQGFFHAWLNACLKAGGQVDRAKSILDKMHSRDIVPDKTCYSILLQCFLASNDNIEGATTWLLDNAEEMEESSIVFWVQQLLSRGDISIVPFFHNFFGNKQPMPLLQILCEEALLKKKESFEKLLLNLPAEEGRTLLKWMKHPTIKMHSIVMRALAQESNPEGAEVFFKAWQEENSTQQIGEEDLKLLFDMYTALVVAWSKVGNTERATVLFEEILEKFSSDPKSLPTNSVAQTAILSAYSKANDPKGAVNFLDKLMEYHRSGQLDDQPDLVMHNIVLSAWMRVGEGERAQEFLETMKERDTVSYNTVIAAYIKEKKIKRATEFAKHFVALYQQSDGRDSRPDLVTFRSILGGMSRSRDPNAAEQGEEILRWMQGLYRDGILEEQPDDKCYQLVLNLWTKSNKDNAGQRAEAILRELIASGTNGSAPALVNASTYQQVMKSYRNQPGRAMALLHEMFGLYSQGKRNCKPTEDAFWSVLQGLSRGRSPEEAHQFLLQMGQLYQSGRLDTAKPTKRAYNLVLQRWAKSKSQKAGERAEFLLRAMQTQYLDHGDRSVQPTTEEYKWVLTSMSKTAKRVADVEAMFQELFGAYCSTGKQKSNLKPDTACVNALFVACRSTGEAERVESILSQIEEWNDKGILNTRPTIISYNLVLACLASAGLAPEAETLLRHMEGRGVHPDTISYNTVMNAWANSKQQNALSHVESLHEKMTTSPDAMTYNTILKVIASSSLSDKSNRAQAVIKMMKEKGFEPSSLALKYFEDGI